MNQTKKKILTLSALTGISISTAQSAIVSWDGSATGMPTKTTNFAGTIDAGDEKWGTTDMTLGPIAGQAGIKAAQSDAALARNRWRYPKDGNRLLVNGGTQTTANGGFSPSMPYTTLVAFDTASFGSDQLSELKTTAANFLAADTTSIHWFVESGAGLYVSESIVTSNSTTAAAYALNSTASIEWFSFGADDKIEDVLAGANLGVSQGEKSLDQMSFTGVKYAGLYSLSTGSSATWHGLSIYNFEATAVAVPEPSSTALIGLAGFALILCRRR